MRTVLIIQARMGSSRLPGKVLRPLLGEPMLARQLERLRRCQAATGIVVATSTEPGDDPLARFCDSARVSCFRGSESDVLARYVGAARAAAADVVVRLTGDCPLIDPEIVDLCVTRFQAAPCDYASNVFDRTYPRGMDTEVFGRDALERAASRASAPEEREHVTPYLYRHPELFQLRSVTSLSNNSRYRLTVDTDDDFRLVEAVYFELYPARPTFGLDDVLALLGRRPDIAALNQHVQQKPVA